MRSKVYLDSTSSTSVPTPSRAAPSSPPKYSAGSSRIGTRARSNVQVPASSAALHHGPRCTTLHAGTGTGQGQMEAKQLVARLVGVALCSWLEFPSRKAKRNSALFVLFGGAAGRVWPDDLLFAIHRIAHAWIASRLCHGFCYFSDNSILSNFSSMLLFFYSTYPMQICRVNWVDKFVHT